MEEFLFQHHKSTVTILHELSIVHHTRIFSAAVVMRFLKVGHLWLQLPLLSYWGIGPGLNLCVHMLLLFFLYRIYSCIYVYKCFETLLNGRKKEYLLKF